MHFSPSITRLESERELRWLGNLWGMDFLFSGEHFFKLERNEDNSTTLIHGEQFGGLLLPLFSGQLEKHTLAGFKSFNEALKAEVEAHTKKPETH